MSDIQIILCADKTHLSHQKVNQLQVTQTVWVIWPTFILPGITNDIIIL